MDPTNIPLFALADLRLAYLDRRTSVLAQNVANADTPGYRSQDLPPFAQILAGTQARVGLQRTSARHLDGNGQGDLVATDPAETQRAPDGNTVSLESEMVRMAETDAAQEVATDIVHKYFTMMKTAAGR